MRQKCDRRQAQEYTVAVFSCLMAFTITNGFFEVEQERNNGN